MLTTSCEDLHIKQNGKFFSKLLSKETSISNPSFRVYYNDVSSTVPFTWETRPGTPKHNTLSDSSLPPLTPPPAFYFRTPEKNKFMNPRSKLLRALLMRITMKKKPHVAFSPSSSSSLSSLSWSTSSVNSNNFSWRRGFSSCGSSLDDEEMSGGGLSKRFCFSLRRGNSGISVKKAVLSIIGRGSD